jgi:hypothetical protein
MKEIYKNPNFYYILVPAVIILWPLFLWAIALPNTEHSWQNEKKQYETAEKVIDELLGLDPDRLDFAGAKSAAADFDYATAVEEVANLCKIPETNYKINSRPITTSGGQKSQGALVVLNKVDIEKFAKFLSTIQLRWANLQCVKVKLTSEKGLPDSWKVDLELKYYY